MKVKVNLVYCASIYSVFLMPLLLYYHRADNWMTRRNSVPCCLLIVRKKILRGDASYTVLTTTFTSWSDVLNRLLFLDIYCKILIPLNFKYLTNFTPLWHTVVPYTLYATTNNKNKNKNILSFFLFFVLY